MFSWYWLADLSVENEIEIVLGHSLYMKAFHDGKTKSDKIDSPKEPLIKSEVPAVQGCTAIFSHNK